MKEKTPTTKKMDVYYNTIIKKNMTIGFYERIISKMHIDVILLIIRAITIIIWVMLIQTAFPITLAINIILMSIIFISDAFDGIISRHFYSQTEQYYFRIADSTVDKVGIFLFMIALLQLNIISMSVTLFIIVYNIALVIPSIYTIISEAQKNIRLIQATVWSRFFAASVGIYCFLSMVSDSYTSNEIVWLTYFVVLGLVSVVSHIVKIKKIKEV